MLSKQRVVSNYVFNQFYSFAVVAVFYLYVRQRYTKPIFQYDEIGINTIPKPYVNKNNIFSYVRLCYIACHFVKIPLVIALW